MRTLKILALCPIILFALPSGVSATQANVPAMQTLKTAEVNAITLPPHETTVEHVETPPGEQLLEAALAQVGTAQDCTDLVQNSLAALGYTTRRDQGGFDFGVQDVAYTFAVQVPASEARPGDIATIGPNNGGHVWIILDPSTGEGVHGGFEGTTAIANNGVPISAHTIYRLV